MKIRDFNLRPGEIHRFGQHTIVLLMSGMGTFQVDFKDYQFASGNILFLSPGQYFKMIKGNLVVKSLAIPADVVQATKNSRFLFRHVVSIGFVRALDIDEILQESTSIAGFLQHAVRLWEIQNPFQAKPEEVETLFNLKETIDKNYFHDLSVDDLPAKINTSQHYMSSLVRRVLRLTPKRMIHDKRLLEAKKEVIFTDRTTKEIAYSVGFGDPKYFGRYFKKNTNMTPGTFRDQFDVRRDSFESRLMKLIDENYKQHRSVAFYSDKFGLTRNALARKVKQVTGSTLLNLVRRRLLRDAQSMLREGKSVTEVAYDLGFAELSYFSTYFNHSVGVAPSHYLITS